MTLASALPDEVQDIRNKLRGVSSRPCGDRAKSYALAVSPTVSHDDESVRLDDCQASGQTTRLKLKPRVPLHLFEILVDELHRHRAFADRRGDALDRTRAYVSGGEHARMAGLEQVRRAGGLPFR